AGCGAAQYTGSALSRIRYAMSDFQPEQLLAAALPPLATFGQEPAHGRTYRSFYGLDALRSGVRGRLGSFRAGPYRLAAQVWLPERPVATLLMLHGYYDHMGLYGNLVDWALSLNFAVLGCDLPGHGLSSGKRASIDDFGEYQAVLHGL